MSKKNFPYIIRISLFFLIFCLFFSIASFIFIPTWDEDLFPQIEAFYYEPKDSIDVLFIGASTFFRGISPLILWEETGFTSYVRATGTQAPVVTYYYLLEALKYQHPKVVVLDVAVLYRSINYDFYEPKLRVAIDPMRLSIEKIQLILSILSGSKKQSFISYFFPFFRYHDRWKVLDTKDFKSSLIGEQDPYKGQIITLDTKPFEFSNNFMEPSNNIEKLNKKSIFYIEKSIQLCKENNIPVILLAMPKIETYGYSKHNGIAQLANKYDLPFIDYSLPENINLIKFDPSSDLKNTTHVNFFGSKKITTNLGVFLQKNYSISDKRNNPEFNQWNLDLNLLKEKIFIEGSKSLIKEP